MRLHFATSSRGSTTRTTGRLRKRWKNASPSSVNVRHAMCVTTAGIGLALGAQALGLRGKVLVPALSFVGTAQSLAWANVDAVFCDVL